MPRTTRTIIAIAVASVFVLVMGYVSMKAWSPSSALEVAEAEQACPHFERLLPEASNAIDLVYASNFEGGYQTHVFAFDASRVDFIRFAEGHGWSGRDFRPLADEPDPQRLIGPAFSESVFRDRIGLDLGSRSAEFLTHAEGGDGESWIYDIANSRGYVVQWSG
jgi:hypothetical protein